MKGKTGLWLAIALAVAALAAGLSGSAQNATQEEKRIAEVLSAIAGAGKVEVALFYDQASGYGAQGSPTGAVVVAEGAEEIAVRLNLIRAVRTLLNLPETAVDVFVMEDSLR